MLKTYSARDQQTVYDLAVLLYADARGIADVLLLNPGLDMDAESYFGQQIIYDDAVRYLPEVFVITPPSPPRPQWRSRDFQNLFDITIQVYGDFNDLNRVISQVDTLNDPGAGVLFNTERTQNLLANTLFITNIVATSPGIAEGGPEGIGVMIIEDTFIVD